MDISDVEPTTNEETTMTINEKYCALLKLVSNLAANIAVEKNKPSNERNETLREIEMQLNKLQSTFHTKDAFLNDDILLAEIILKLSQVYLSEDKKDKLYIAKGYLMECVHLLKGKEQNSKAIFTVIKVFYELGNIWNKLRDIKQSEEFMYKLVELYLTYTKQKDDYPVPIHLPAVIGVEIEKNYIYEMDTLYMRVLYSLLVYGNVSKSTKYASIDNFTMIICAHRILTKMLKTAPLSIGYLEWATFSSQLSLEFLKYKRFNEARHHLAAASHFIGKFYEEKLNKGKSQVDGSETHNTYNEIAADIAIKWAKYGNTLLHLSGVRLLYKKEKDEFADPATQSLQYVFVDLEDELRNFTTLIRDTYIMNYKEAKVVFRRVLKWLEQAKEHAIKGKMTKKYINISRGIFHAYKYLARYEHEKSDQVRLYKELMDNLHDLLKLLHVDDNYYTDTRRYILLQLVLASYSLLDIKTEELDSHEQIKSDLSTEIDKLIKHNIHNSELYLHGNT